MGSATEHGVSAPWPSIPGKLACPVFTILPAAGSSAAKVLDLPLQPKW